MKRTSKMTPKLFSAAVPWGKEWRAAFKAACAPFATLGNGGELSDRLDEAVAHYLGKYESGHGLVWSPSAAAEIIRLLQIVPDDVFAAGTTTYAEVRFMFGGLELVTPTSGTKVLLYRRSSGNVRLAVDFGESPSSYRANVIRSANSAIEWEEEFVEDADEAA